MLLKIIGSVTVIFASGLIGYVQSRECSRRPGELRVLQGLLQMFETEISYLSDVITDAFTRVAKSSSNEVTVFFRDTVNNLMDGTNRNACAAWELAVTDNIRVTALNKEDEAILLAFGKMLGNSDMEGQIKNIRLTVNQLKMQEQKAEESRKKNEPMYRNLGLLGGIAIVIVII